MTTTLHFGDNLPHLRGIATNSVDAIVTDPPYGISFMGARWDYDIPSVETWRECLRVLKPGGHMLAFASTRTQHRMACRIEDAGFEIRDLLAYAYGSGFPKSLDVSKKLGENWTGWKTCLKPAFEPITLARKPLSGTVAQTVLEHGTGALNIDGCRIPYPDGETPNIGGRAKHGRGDGYGFKPQQDSAQANPARYPANILHDDSEEVHEVFGHASRFFYGAKASKKDRGEGNTHPTVKPTDLMRYLCRLITPPGGTILDPFMGSGSTGKAAALEGFDFIGCEIDQHYFDIATARIEYASGKNGGKNAN